MRTWPINLYRSSVAAFTTAEAAISNKIYHDNDKDYAGHCQYDASERTSFLNLANLVVSDLHIAVDARFVVNPVAQSVDLLGKLTDVDQWQYEESDAQGRVEQSHHAGVAPFATTVAAASAEEEGFQELQKEHDTKEDECNDPNSKGHSKRVGDCFDISEDHQRLINRIFARGVEL